ncbi:acyltransferase family protein [Rhizosaccharibacter radicis]|uniref:Acyltransferase n=1 Tax=Rhizosaccharibacter radicis TaxID=2782605 RepID=A0ABT1VXZ8_9PROT|nr:acyltransferase [Acetobacteraceae bacterium KSS12]
MDFYATWPGMGCAVAALLLVALPPFGILDPPMRPRADHLSRLDGLRGLLALGVFLHHAAIYHVFSTTGRWAAPPARFYRTVGPAAVAMFFMITGLLFFGKLLAEDGRPDWPRLFVGRIARIAPLYLASVVAMLATVLGISPHLHVPPLDLARQVGSWLLLGFGSQPDVNGYGRTWALDAGVTWTLHYEWLFYIALLPLGLLVRFRLLSPASTILCLAACLAWAALTPDTNIPPSLPVLLSMFLAGIAAAAIRRARCPIGTGVTGSVAILLLLGLTFLCPGRYGFEPTLLLGGAFFLIAGGNTLFGLLESRPAIRLGHISFGVYLLQGQVLWTVFHLVPPSVTRSPAGFWYCVAAACLSLVLVATAAHLAIERPGIELGRRVGTRLRSGSRTTASEA